MKTELQAKFIQHLNNRKQNEAGFTLIELLVTILIVGILAAIALPSLLKQEVKAKQTEAKQNILLVRKSQSSYRAEKNQFASSFDILAIGSISGGATGTTTNFSYTIDGGQDTATIIASPSDSALKGYSGGVIRYDNAASQSVIGTVVCEMQNPGAVVPAVTTFGTNSVTCTGLQTAVN